MWRLVFLLFLLPAVSWAGISNAYMDAVRSGSNKVTVSNTGPRVDTVADILARRSYNPNPGPDGGALLRDLLSKPMPGPGGDRVFSPAVLERPATRAALMRGMYRAMPVIGTALLVDEVVKAAGCEVTLSPPFLRCENAMTMQPDPDLFYTVGGSSAHAELASAVYYWRKAIVESVCNTPTLRCELRVDTIDPFQGTNNRTDLRFTFFNRKERYSVFDQYGNFTGYAFRPIPDQSGITDVYRGAGGNSLKCDFALQPDGSCTLIPSEDDFAKRGDPSQDSPRPGLPPLLPDLAEHMDKGGVPYGTGPGVITEGPSVLPDDRVNRTNNPDGSVTVTDRYWDMIYTPTATESPEIEWKQRDVTTTYPPGTTVPPYNPAGPGTPPPGGSGSTSTGQPTVKTCGLPDTPPCKIDERGTPSWDKGDPGQLVTGAFAALMACIASPTSCMPALPAINWAFALPTGCTVIPLPAFAPFVTQVDVCQFQSVIHDLMSILWVAAGLFGAVGLVYRDSVGGA